MQPYLVYITAKDKPEAEAIATALLEARLIACANIMDGAESLYRWEGNIQRAREAVLICKTVEARVGEVIARVQALHGYEVPCITAWPIAAGNEAFLQWVGEEVR